MKNLGNKVRKLEESNKKLELVNSELKDNVNQLLKPFNELSGKNI